MYVSALLAGNFIVSVSDVAPSTNNHPVQHSTAFTQCYQYSGDPPYNALIKVGHLWIKQLRQSNFTLVQYEFNSIYNN